MFLGELVEAPRGSALYHYKRWVLTSAMQTASGIRLKGYLKSQKGAQNVLLY